MGVCLYCVFVCLQDGVKEKDRSVYLREKERDRRVNERESFMFEGELERNKL